MERRLVEALEGGAVLVVPTRRLQRAMTRRYDEAQCRSGRSCWPSGRVFPLSVWAQSVWDST